MNGGYVCAWLLIAAAAPALVSSADCGQGDAACDCVLLAATCRSPNYATRLPPVPANLSSLIISKYNLGTVPNNSFAGLRQLDILTLSGNGIGALERFAFAGMASLRELKLSSNSIAALPERVFVGLGQLTLLALDENELDSLSPDVFLGLSRLITLDLGGNFIGELPSKAFKYLTSLQNLRLVNNRLVTLPADILWGLTSLTSITLSSNFLSTLSDDGLFEDNVQLTAVDLSRNRLTQISATLLANCTQLKSLDISGASLPCDCESYAFRAWLDSPAAASVKSAWVASPTKSGACSSPAFLQSTPIINVPAAAFVCTTTTAGTTTASAAPTSATTKPTSAPATAPIKVSGGTPLARTDQETTAASGLPGNALAIILGTCFGAAIVAVIVVVAWVVCRKKRQQPKANLARQVLSGPPASSAKAGSIAIGGTANTGYSNSNDSSDGTDRGSQSSHPTAGADVPPELMTERGRSVAGYYERIAGNLTEAAAGATQRSTKMNGLLPYAYTRQNSDRSLSLSHSKVKAKTPAESDEKRDDPAALQAASLGYYSSLGAISPPTSSRQLSKSAAVYRSLRAGSSTLPSRNPPTTPSLRADSPQSERFGPHNGGQRFAMPGAAATRLPAEFNRAAREFTPSFESAAASNRNPFSNPGADLGEKAPKSPGMPRSPSWHPDAYVATASGSYVLPTPTDFSTLESSKSLPSASGSAGSGGGGVAILERTRYINDTPV